MAKKKSAIKSPKSQEMKIEMWPIGRITRYSRNPRINDPAVAVVRKSIEAYGFRQPIVVDRKGVIVIGDTRYKASLELGLPAVPVHVAGDLAPAKIKALRIMDNKSHEASVWDTDLLVGEIEALKALDFDLFLTGFNADELAVLETGAVEACVPPTREEAAKGLAERFVVPPFSVLDSRQGYWQERKRAWLALGISGPESRENIKTAGSLSGTVPGYYSKKAACEARLGRKLSNHEFETEYLAAYLPRHSQIACTVSGGILSIFDPVLCEIVYRWFCPATGCILDPFAGGPVRGIVAAFLGHKYTGIELRGDQVGVNRANAKEIGVKPEPLWIAGDGAEAERLAPGHYDLIFSCPPYYDREVYSDMPGELSALPGYKEFLAAYYKIIVACLHMLKPNRFAVFVVGDIRDKRGFCRHFVSDTIAAFEAAGAGLYNEAVLVTCPGSLPVRAAFGFPRGRKLGRSHQNVLVFYKGKPRAIATEFPEVEVGELRELQTEQDHDGTGR